VSALNHKRKKQCGDKFRWPSMKAAQAYCFHKQHGGVHIRAYHCRHCGGIHVGHFRQDELPTVEVVMSKTRVYSVFCGRCREGGIHLDREGAEEERAHFANPVVMEKDISDEEYAAIAIDYMEQETERKAWERQRNPRPTTSEEFDLSVPEPVAPDSWMSPEGWRPSERPEPPAPKRADRPSPREGASNRKRGSR